MFFFLAQSLSSTNKSLSGKTKPRFALSLVEYLYLNISLIEMLSGLKVAKKHVHVYYFHGKNFTCWDLRGMLELTTLSERIVKRLYGSLFVESTVNEFCLILSRLGS